MLFPIQSYELIFLISLGISLIIAIGAIFAGDLTEDEERDGILGILDWGRVPFTTILLIFTLTFGLTGMAMDIIVRDLMNGPGWWGWLLVVFSFLLAIAITRKLSSALRRFLPASETHVARPEDLVGHHGAMFTSTFADIQIGADVHRIECQASDLNPGDQITVTDYNFRTKLHTVAKF